MLKLLDSESTVCLLQVLVSVCWMSRECCRLTGQSVLLLTKLMTLNMATTGECGFRAFLLNRIPPVEQRGIILSVTLCEGRGAELHDLHTQHKKLRVTAQEQKQQLCLDLMGLALQGVLSETKTVTGIVGQSITLNTRVTGLHGDDQILWSYGPKQHVLVNYMDGELVRIESERFQLDRVTVCLTILSLSPEDAGSYKGQIINGNGSTHYFHLIVEKPAEPSTDTEGSSPDSAADQKTHVVAVLVVAVGVVLFA
ncbi:uncharacterized protein [Pagrus major]|uniref:uncharacterized protein n=1 Tax=Pagrus major TaxID=143350 RepID=UPI003CC8CD9C